MPNRNDYNSSRYIKGDNQPHHTTKSSRGLFDLPSGASKRMPQKTKTNSSIKKTSGGFFDLPSGAGKREKIMHQQQINQQRQNERLGAGKQVHNSVNIPNDERIFAGGVKNFSASNVPANLEKDLSKTRLQTTRFYIKEIGYYVKPLFIYFVAVFVFLLLGALGKFNGYDFRIMSLAVFAPILVVGGVFVNRYMSIPGFILLGILNFAGGLLGHIGAVEKAPVFAQRIIKLFNIPYFAFNTDTTKMDSIVLIASVVAILGFVYVGSLFHNILHIFRKQSHEEE